MKRAIDFVKLPLVFPVWVLGAIYLFWLLSTPMDIPFDDNFRNFFAGLKIAAIYIFITLLASAASRNWKWSLLFIVLLSPLILGAGILAAAVFQATEFSVWNQSKPVFVAAMLIASICPVAVLLIKTTYKNRKLSLLLLLALLPIFGGAVAYPMYFYPDKRQEAELGKYKYYIYGVTDWDNHVFQEFFKCPKGSFNCAELNGSYSAIWQIYVDEESREVRLLRNGNDLQYVEGTQTHWYGWEGRATLQDITYALQYYEENGMRRFVLNKCLDESPEYCTVIPLDFSLPASGEELETIIENPSANELYILSEQKIRYVYGHNSQEYQYLDSLQVTGTGEYYIYSFAKDQGYRYFLYGCEREYSCWSMPFTYSTPKQEQADLQYDEKTDKLLVRVGGKRIFTYKGIVNSRCYDGWCAEMECFAEECAFWEKQ